MNLVQSQIKVMTSHEIADLTGKRHPDVKRDIVNMLNDLQEDVSRFAHTYLDSQNRKQTQYHLDKLHTECLLTGYSAKARMMVIKRWQELEAKEIETTEQLMARALISAQSVIEDKNRQLEEAKPAIELHESIVNDDSTLCMRDAGKKLQVKPNKFVEWLRASKYLTYDNIAYQAHINTGYLVLSTTEQNGKPRTNTRVTGKGFAHFGKKIAELRFVNPTHEIFYK
jgi:phage antirepressor YoqD-like protein